MKQKQKRLKPGDIIKMDVVYSVNPETRVSVEDLLRENEELRKQLAIANEFSQTNAYRKQA